MLERIRSLPVQGAWIEMLFMVRSSFILASLPVQGAWIEISSAERIFSAVFVAPRAGSVD